MRNNITPASTMDFCLSISVCLNTLRNCPLILFLIFFVPFIEVLLAGVPFVDVNYAIEEKKKSKYTCGNIYIQF